MIFQQISPFIFKSWDGQVETNSVIILLSIHVMYYHLSLHDGDIFFHFQGQFYPPGLFCRYNMFNHFFLDGAKSEDVFHNFLSSNHGNDIVMVTDPPFGGLVEVLAAGVKWIMDAWKRANDKG